MALKVLFASTDRRGDAEEGLNFASQFQDRKMTYLILVLALTPLVTFAVEMLRMRFRILTIVTFSTGPRTTEVDVITNHTKAKITRICVFRGSDIPSACESPSRLDAKQRRNESKRPRSRVGERRSPTVKTWHAIGVRHGRDNAAFGKTDKDSQTPNIFPLSAINLCLHLQMKRLAWFDDTGANRRNQLTSPTLYRGARRE